MTLNLAAIFGAEPTAFTLNVVASAVAGRTVDYRAVAPVNQSPTSAGDSPAPWPIVEGSEHYQVFVDDEDVPWPDFIPGFHYDFRQPSRLRPLCSPR